MIKFYDTSSLLKGNEQLFENEERFAISSITLDELENIKTSAHKDDDVKFEARQLLRELDKHLDDFDIIIFSEKMLKPFKKQNLEITNDIKILSCAYFYSRTQKIEFFTEDLTLKVIAKMFMPVVSSVKINDDNYKGYIDKYLTEEELNEIYQNPKNNFLNLQENEYLVIRDKDNQIIDRLVRRNNQYCPLNFKDFDSSWFGKVKPMKNDVYQQFVCDSLSNNQITMIKGSAGTGKTYLALGYLLHLLHRGKIDKIIIFCNTVATKGSAKLGYYPGTRDEKLLDSQIGNLLSSKLGGRVEVERMIMDEQIILLPFSDIRGYDTSGMNAGIYISEAQNLDISLMKLALQRVGEDSICIIDGDCKTQVDDISFAGSNNGMKRLSKIFRGHDLYGEVELQNIHRSKIARIAELM